MNTYGSKDKNKVAVAAVMNKNVFSARHPDEATIFSAEAKAIEIALEHIKMSKYTHFTSSSDLLSCLQSFNSMNIDHPYIMDIFNNYYCVSNQGKIINFCWIPRKIGIKVKNEADKAAKSARV